LGVNLGKGILQDELKVFHGLNLHSAVGLETSFNGYVHQYDIEKKDSKQINIIIFFIKPFYWVKPAI